MITAVSGKGGVGKSKISAALALYYASKEMTLLIDSDKKGKAIVRTISPEEKTEVYHDRIFETGIPRLLGGTTFYRHFKELPRADSKEAKALESKGVDRNEQFRQFIEQFPEDYGLVAIHALIPKFFGLHTNPEQIAEFVKIVRMIIPSKQAYEEIPGLDFQQNIATEDAIENIVLDMEPTKGTARLLENIAEATKTIDAMACYGWAKMLLIKSSFPDVARFIDGDYVKNSVTYGERLKSAMKKIKQARFILVCNPRSDSIEEMLEETQEAVDLMGARTAAYIVNDVRNLQNTEGKDQEAQIEAVKEAARKRNIPEIKVMHDPILCIKGMKDAERQYALRKVGEDISRYLN